MAAKAKAPKRTAAQARKRSKPQRKAPASAPQKLRLASGTPRARGQFRLGDAVGDLYVDDEGVVTFREVE